MKNNKITRRDFIKGVAASTVGLAAMGVLGACTGDSGDTKGESTTAAVSTVPVTGSAETTGSSDTETKDGSADTYQWDKEADVVIVGAGGTGLAAAIEAAGAGADVLILEKGEEVGGTTVRSGCVMQAAGTTFQKENSNYTDDTAEKHLQYYLAAGEGQVAEELVEDITTNAASHIDWLQDDVGVVWESIYGGCRIPYIDESLMADRIHSPEGGATAVVDLMTKAAEDNGAVIECETEVTRLITDADNGVIGVEAVQGGSTILVKAAKAVLLATASIDRNEEMAKELSPQQYWDLTTQDCVVATTNTGDGIRMGMQIGAAVCGFGGAIDYNGTTGMGTTNANALFPCIFVNSRGLRFMCEESTYSYMMRAVYQQEMNFNGPTYMIFAENSLNSATSRWSKDDITDAVDAGTVIKAASLDELAEAISVSAVNLTDSVNNWNSYMDEGEDRAFDRTQGLEKLEGENFYAMQIKSSNLGSIGGLKINVDTQVLDANGEVIPRLYSAGLNAGGWLGNYYPSSGTAIMGCMHQGRKAGKAMAALTSWS